MTEKIQKIIDCVTERNFESFKKNLFLVVSEKIEESLGERRIQVSSSILEANDPAAASAEADAEKQALFVDPNMAKEFFIKDLDYKDHVITLKTLGTGIGKPVVAYIDGEQFEVFTDKEIAEKESKQAVDRMISRGIENLADLRKSKSQLKAEAQKAKETQKTQETQKQDENKNK
jgi:hypothetical protein